MKQLILLLFLFSTCHIMAQRRINGVNNLYAKDTTFYENGYAYQCDVLEGAMYITLYNKENKYTYVDQTFKETNFPVSMDDNRYSDPHLESDNWTKPKTFSIINNAFSAEEKARVKGCEVGILLYINSDTGKIMEVEYQFVGFKPFASIPVSVYRKIETELKANVWFVPTEEGKRRNYILRCWRHEVR